MGVDWVRQIIATVSNIVDYIGGLIPAGLGVLLIGAFGFLSLLAIKRVII